MQFNWNNFDLNNVRLVLANPQGVDAKIDLISGVRELEIHPFFNSISETSFKLYKFYDGKKHPLYDKIEDGRLVLFKGVAWFQIQEAPETQEEKSKVKYKQIKCMTLENQLINKKIDDINGVFALYDESDHEHSLLHIVMQSCGWKVGHISSDLLTKYRTFSEDTVKIYNFLTTTVSKSFDCIFQFDYFNKTINAYKLSELGELTSITISDKNILKSYVKSSNLDKIVTKMRVKGGSNVSDGTTFDIRGVNPTGSDYIFNVDYYMTLDWMSQGLIDALNGYKAKYNAYQTQYTTTLSTLKQYHSELTILNKDLVDIEANIKAQNDVKGASVENHKGNPPVLGDADYDIYQNAIALLATYTMQKANKEAEISSKQSQINTTQAQLDNIGTDLDMNSNFTQAQLVELDAFLIEGDDYTDETFVATSEMTDSEIIDMKLELLTNAMNELSRVCHPQYTIQTTISNLFTIQDNMDAKISYDSWRKQFVLGNLITLKLRDDYAVTVRLIEMNLKADDSENIDVIFSDKTRLDSEEVQIGEIIAQANSMSSAYSLSKLSYDAAKKQTSDFMNFKNGVLNATLNQMVSDNYAQIMQDQYGLHIRQWLEDAKAYSPYQMWLNPYRMLMTNDGFKSCSSAFGLLTSPTGEQFMGINTEMLMGLITLTKDLYVSNESGNFNINKDGLNYTNGINSILMNPNTQNLFQIQKNGVAQFYIDTDGNVCSAGKITGGSIAIGNGVFSVDQYGNMNCSSANITGNIVATSGSLGGFTIDNTQMVYNGGTASKYFRISPISTMPGGTVYTTDYGAIDMGLSDDGKDTLVHICSNGYVRFGLDRLDGAIRFNYKGMFDGDEYVYPMYSKSFKVLQNGIVFCDWIQSQIKMNLWGNQGMVCGSDGKLDLMGSQIDMSSTISSERINFTINGSPILTVANVSASDIGIESTDITPKDTGHGNIEFKGSGLNAASVDYCLSHFEPLTSSDVRLKNDISPINISKDMFMGLKPKQFRYKTEESNNKLNFGLVAQEVENLFIKYGLDPNDYDLLDKVDVIKYESDGMYVKDKVHRINYRNLIGLMIKMLQDVYNKVDEHDALLKNM